MSKYNINQQIFNLPVFLSPNELQNPMAVLVNFFADSSLSEIRGHLWDMLATCITTNEPPFNESYERTELIYFLGRVEIVFEAAYVLANRANEE
jgi:hypothetical protein